MKRRTRRKFLQDLGAAGAGAALTGCGRRDRPETADAANADLTGWIDSHVHVWTPDTARYPLRKGYDPARLRPPSFTPAELFAECRPCGVSRIVLVQPGCYGFDHSFLLDSMEAHPGVFGGVALVEENERTVAKAMKSLAGKGIRGFRVRATRERSAGWPESSAMNRMWKTAADTGLFLCCLADPDGLPIIRKMCEIHPAAPVVIDHCARIGVSGTIDQADLDNLLGLADFDTVHVKTSAFYALGRKEAPHTDLAPMIRQLRDAFGVGRLMWGSDCPYQTQKGHTYLDSIALIRDRLDFLTEADKQWMLRGTAEKVFFGSRER